MGGFSSRVNRKGFRAAQDVGYRTTSTGFEQNLHQPVGDAPQQRPRERIAAAMPDDDQYPLLPTLRLRNRAAPCNEVFRRAATVHFLRGSPGPRTNLAGYASRGS